MAATSYDEAVKDFIGFLSANPCVPTTLMPLFVPNPWVGITTNGPIYSGPDEVKQLFTAVASTFPRFCFEKVLQYEAPTTPAVIVTGTLRASHSGTKWDPGFDSSPLNGAQVPKGKLFRSLAACCIFTFPAPQGQSTDFLISSLAIYFDRYQMLQQLNLVGSVVATRQVVAEFRELDQPRLRKHDQSRLREIDQVDVETIEKVDKD
jgi:hypothetical protein